MSHYHPLIVHPSLLKFHLWTLNPPSGSCGSLRCPGKGLSPLWASHPWMDNTQPCISLVVSEEGSRPSACSWRSQQIFSGQLGWAGDLCSQGCLSQSCLGIKNTVIFLYSHFSCQTYFPAHKYGWHFSNQVAASFPVEYRNCSRLLWNKYFKTECTENINTP